MIRTPCLLLVAALALGGEPAATIPAAYAAYTTTARSVAPAGTSRAATITALHAFVLIPAAGEPAPVELTMPALGAIAGKLRDPPGKGRATVVAVDPAARAQVRSEVAADGSFRIAPVPVGTYTVSSYAGRGGDGSQLTATCTVTAGADTVLALDGRAAGDGQRVGGRITLPDGLTGKMRLTLMPDPDRPVTASTMAGFNRGANAQVAEDGTFSFPRIPNMAASSSRRWRCVQAWIRSSCATPSGSP